jgi:DNA-directed RNA polymerase specialized sigma24 family protein
LPAPPPSSPFFDRPAPADYTELADWRPYVKRIALGSGLPRQEVDDFASEVFVYFLERDSLAYYDPAVAPFSAFLRAYVVKRLFSFRRELARRAFELDRSPDKILPGGEGEENATLGDVFYAAPIPRSIDWVVSASELHRFHSWLEARDERLANLFARLCYEVSTEVAPNRYRLAEFLGCSLATVDSLMVMLRETAANFGLLDD